MDSSACSIVEVAVSRALEDEAVSILTKGKGAYARLTKSQPPGQGKGPKHAASPKHAA